jgi:hypothetical protein
VTGLGVSAGLFVLAGLCEIGGGYLVWGRMRDQKPLSWAPIGAATLALYGVVAAPRAARSAAQGRSRSYPGPADRPNAQRRRSAMTSNAVETVLASASLRTDS